MSGALGDCPRVAGLEMPALPVDRVVVVDRALREAELAQLALARVAWPVALLGEEARTGRGTTLDEEHLGFLAGLERAEALFLVRVGDEPVGNRPFGRSHGLHAEGLLEIGATTPDDRRSAKGRALEAVRSAGRQRQDIHHVAPPSADRPNNEAIMREWAGLRKRHGSGRHWQWRHCNERAGSRSESQARRTDPARSFCPRYRG